MTKCTVKSDVNRKPKCLGTGLLSLDLIYQDLDRPYAAAGGSCGNVMAILSSFGWEASPAGSIGRDVAADILLHDLQSLGVITDWVDTVESVQTPIILEFLNQVDEVAVHSFSRTCHKTNQKLARYNSISDVHFQKLSHRVQEFDVYYFDRLDHISVAISKLFKKQDKPVFFEPQKLTDLQLFLDVLPYVDILKVSEDADPQIFEALEFYSPQLTVVTRGKRGLSYQVKDRQSVSVTAMEQSDFVDACGSGDWLSATIINDLLNENIRSLESLTDGILEAALFRAQVNSAQNLAFAGARGSMYQKQIDAFSSEREFTCKNGIKLKGAYLQLQDDVPPFDLLEQAVIN
jgi:fructokinase